MQEHGHTRGHTDCQVLNLDGLVALARGRGAQIPAILDELAKRSANVDFLGTPETIRLVTALLRRRAHLAPCRDYLRMIQRQAPSEMIAKMLADVEAAMRRRGAPKKKAKTRPSEPVRSDRSRGG